MNAVLGASLGVGGIRAVSLDLSVDPPLSTESFVRIPDGSDDPWGSVTWAVHRLAREQNADAGSAVLALRDKNPTESYGVEQSDGLILVSDLGAQVGALQESGDIAGEQTVALFDVGAGGVTMSIVDVATGHVHSSRRSTVLSGDGCDAALSTFLLENHGPRSRLSQDAVDLMVEEVCSAKETLSTLTAVEISGPFRGGTVLVHRSELDALIRDAVFDAVTMAAAMLDAGPHVDALYAVGGGANMQIVRQSLLDALTVPVFVPREPELLATRGAAGMARRHAASTAVAGRAARPRHSDTSSRRLTRLRSSRYLGGAVAALVAGGVVLSIAAASSRTAVPEVEYTQVITSSEAVPSTSGVQIAVPSAESQDTSATETPTTTPTEETTEQTTTRRTTTSEDPTTTTDRRRESTTTAAPTTTTEPRPTRTRDQDPVATVPPPATTTVATTKVATAASPTRAPSTAPTTRRHEHR